MEAHARLRGGSAERALTDSPAGIPSALRGLRAAVLLCAGLRSDASLVRCDRVRVDGTAVWAQHKAEPALVQQRCSCSAEESCVGPAMRAILTFIDTAAVGAELYRHRSEAWSGQLDFESHRTWVRPS